MRLNRRDLVRGALAAAFLPEPWTIPEALAETGGLQRAINAATAAGQPYILRAGTFRTEGLDLSEGARLIGVRGQTRLKLVGKGPLIRASNLQNVSLTGLVCQSGTEPLDEGSALVDCVNVVDFEMSDCVVEQALGIGLSLKNCGGWIERSRVRDVQGVGIASLDATGLVIRDNIVERCGDNGIQVWRSAQGDDGTHLSGNRVMDISNRLGGSGQYGNGISLFRAGGVTVIGNAVRRCAFSAIRNNGGSDVIVSGNTCADLGETAIFAEFDFSGCVIADNTIDSARSGIQIVNFADPHGQTGTCSGNIIRNLRAAPPHDGQTVVYDFGIKAEADVTISGNVVEGAPWVGILVGWGPFLRDVSVTGNVVRNAPIGIGVSMADGAGKAVIANNMIAGATQGAIRGMAWEKPTTGDLTREAPPPRIQVSGNQVS